jgi:hypothetical protein
MNGISVEVELTYDQIDQVVVKELRECYRLNSKPIKIDCSDDCIEPDEEFLQALEVVLNYYQNQSEKLEWAKEKKGFVMEENSWNETEWTKGVNYHGKQKEALDFAIEALTDISTCFPEVANEVADKALEKIEEILK